MLEALIGIGMGIIIVLFLSPYFSLWHLKDIAEELTNIRYILEKKDKEK